MCPESLKIEPVNKTQQEVYGNKSFTYKDITGSIFFYNPLFAFKAYKISVDNAINNYDGETIPIFQENVMGNVFPYLYVYPSIEIFSQSVDPETAFKDTEVMYGTLDEIFFHLTSFNLDAIIREYINVSKGTYTNESLRLQSSLTLGEKFRIFLSKIGATEAIRGGNRFLVELVTFEPVRKKVFGRSLSCYKMTDIGKDCLNIRARADCLLKHAKRFNTDVLLCVRISHIPFNESLINGVGLLENYKNPFRLKISPKKKMQVIGSNSKPAMFKKNKFKFALISIFKSTYFIAIVSTISTTIMTYTQGFGMASLLISIFISAFTTPKLEHILIIFVNFIVVFNKLIISSFLCKMFHFLLMGPATMTDDIRVEFKMKDSHEIIDTFESHLSEEVVLEKWEEEEHKAKELVKRVLKEENSKEYARNNREIFD